MTLVAIAGLACVALLIASATLGVSLVVFRSGSMAPTIPAGSVAVVRTVPAASIRVGDVVTVTTSRSPHPVTHRVVRIEPTSDPDTRVLTMRGDANSGVDPFTYRVKEARKVLWSAPGLAPVLAAAQSPVALASATVVLTVVVVWAFWPRETDSHAIAPRRSRSRGLAL